MELREISGIFATSEYLPEQRLWGDLMRLAPDAADLSRMDSSGVPYLLDHDRGRVVGTIQTAEVSGDEYSFTAAVPTGAADDDDVPARCREYLREYDAGLRGRISPGYIITALREVEYDMETGLVSWDASWRLLEISDVTVPADTAAQTDRHIQISSELLREASGRREMMVSTREQGAISQGDSPVDAVSDLRAEELASVSGLPSSRDAGAREGDLEPESDDHDDDMDDDDDDRSGESDERSEPEATRAARRRSARDRPLPEASPDSDRTLPQDVNIHPNARVPRSDDLRQLDLGNYLRAAIDPNRYRVTAKRELAWMERNLGTGVYREAEGAGYVPFSLLATSGPAAKQRSAMRAMRGIREEEYLEGYMQRAENALREIREQEQGYGERTLVQTVASAGAATSTMVDLARSIMWLTEMDSALEMMTVVPGLAGRWQGFYGMTKPAVSYPPVVSGQAIAGDPASVGPVTTGAEGGDLTETTPTFQALQRLPVTMGMHWSISTAQLASADAPISAMIETGCEAVFRTQAMRAFLSGNRNAGDFDIQAGAFNGLLNSGIVETGFGAAMTDLARDDMVDARRRLFAAETDMMGLGWILSNSVASQLEKTRIGGTESVRFVYENGMVDSGAEMIPARDTVHLGKTTGTASNEVAVPDIAVLLQRSAAVCLIWGAGIAFNGLQIPGRTRMDFDLQIQSNFAMMNPARATVLKRGA